MPSSMRADGMYNFMTDVHIHVGVGGVGDGGVGGGVAQGHFRHLLDKKKASTLLTKEEAANYQQAENAF